MALYLYTLDHSRQLGNVPIFLRAFIVGNSLTISR